MKSYQDRDLKYILFCIYSCYLEILNSSVLVKNDENSIRDLFICDDYLDNHQLKEKLGIGQYKFDKEIQIQDGRVDIRVLDMIKIMKGDYRPYYFIECKRLDGANSQRKNSLNNKYLNDGLSRFITEKYPTYLEANGMIGFVVENIDIGDNSKHFPDFQYDNFIENFKFTYRSCHVTQTLKRIVLYHLMLDFSSKLARKVTTDRA
ncbi:hypothetical protein [Sphingobacterium multivorum]|uniref:hypothetical protein n=1 Tax=Sphingobacterium multivorum TaxID=28454 RepID=UPI00142DFE0B|nr:hypothetical protein [Sphingobacterium multivorum]